MKKFGILFLVISSQIFFAQASRFIYQVTMKPDSTDQSVKTELANLDISGSTSLFYADNRLKRDSVMARMRQTKNFDRSQMENLRTNMDYIVEKDLRKATKTFKSRIARDQYSYEEDRPMEWKILPETANIGDYKTQKAETEFAGRRWNAWFTMDIPIQDGPYKFSGLPGLIVKVADENDNYSFDLKESKKIAAIANFTQGGSVISLKRKDFLKQQSKFKEDPTAMLSGSGRGGNRNQVNPTQRKERENRIKDDLKKNNNPIELD